MFLIYNLIKKKMFILGIKMFILNSYKKFVFIFICSMFVFLYRYKVI